MNSKTLRAKYLKFAILIISICFILGAISACLPFNISIPTLDNDTINNTAMTITQNSSDGLGEFNDGYTYVYTDKTKIDNFRAGLINYDITLHSVAKTSTNRGSQDNPYVIATTTDWETFVKFCGVDLTKSTDKYFVLANDLDFDGIDFHPVSKFGGTFYGMGHKLLNINCSNWQYWNGVAYVTIGTTGQTNSGFGVFCSVTNATITDLINQDYTFADIPNTNVSGTSAYHGPYTGGIVGISYGNSFILNCHTSGNVNSNITTDNYFVTGGIIGAHTPSGSNKTLYLYRSSSNIE